MMQVCPRHNRWTRIDRADGTSSERRCPECPSPRPRLFLHLPTGRVLRPEPFGRFILPDP